MKNICIKFMLLLVPLFSISCVNDLLEQIPRKEMAEEVFWKTVDDATYAMYGVYQGSRTFFHKNYAWDGGSEMMHARVSVPYGNYNPAAIGGSYLQHWKDGYQVINRSNYVLMKLHNSYNQETDPGKISQLKRVEGEILFLRSIVYFRLIDLWGDVPYYTHVLKGNNEAYTLTRTPKAAVKDSIIRDLTEAISYLPATLTSGDYGRTSRAAAYGFRGKIKLYWACWMKNEGKAAEADQYYRAAAEDFKEVMKPEYGRKLYKEGISGTEDNPFYGELFDGQHEADGYASEVLFATSNAGPGFGVGLGDTYIYDFGTRSTGAGGCNVTPTIRLVNRYQLLSTGENAPDIVTGSSKTLANGACNPKTYEGRDYRLKASIMWDGQKMMRLSDDGKTVGPDTLTFEYKQGDNVKYINAQGCYTGYIYRKFVRQYAFGPREEGQQDLYLMRLPDVWLMYCEAVNEYNNGPTSELFDLVNKIRKRGALPELNQSKFSTKETFFKAIEQERIIEFVAEGHRFFDLRRWNVVESIWKAPNGLRLTSTWGESDWYRDEFRNAIERDYQRFYIFQIPPSEILMNSGLKQNECWL